MELTDRNQLGGIVSFLPPMMRTELQEVYAAHDVLFFHSVFQEPVALVLMEAFAAGLPVVASRPGGKSRLVQDGITCLCYQPDDPESLVDAVVTMLTRADLRHGISSRAQQLIREEFSLEKMGQEYDELLRQFVSGNLEKSGTAPVSTGP
jgi:glycosyltransferase involved in cell wall biosynthesis